MGSIFFAKRTAQNMEGEIAGFVISLLGLIMILFVFALIAAAIGVAGVSSAIVATLF